MISVKIHTRGGERLLAACDEELLGRSFSEGDMRLKASVSFYGGESVTEETLRERMRSVTVMNLVGERAVRTAEEAGYVSPDSVITVDGVRHAQAVIM
ncbi:MAG: DUF424 family protein [Methanomassiliicoccaceae archaeon]|nr:DUF424 family protein [Methanomassiliicoccaceae archaeon]